jgi:hypothetical protein
MARHSKATVDYYPKKVTESDSLQILQDNFANDGYVFWFKLLDLLGRTERHYLDLSTEENKIKLELLCGKSRISHEKGLQILKRCSELGMIDKELYKQEIILSENFLDGIEDAYKRRKVDFWNRNTIIQFLSEKERINGIDVYINTENVDKNQQRKEEKRREDKTKEEEIPSSNFTNFFSEKTEQNFINICRNHKKIKSNLQDKKIFVENIQDFYSSISNDFPAETIFKALKTYIDKKIPQYGISGDFRLDFNSWLVKEKPPVQQPKVRGEEKFVPEVVDCGDPLGLPRDKALEFCKAAPRSSKFRGQLIAKWNFSAVELGYKQPEGLQNEQS